MQLNVSGAETTAKQLVRGGSKWAVKVRRSLDVPGTSPGAEVSEGRGKVEAEICRSKLRDIVRMKDELQKKLMSLDENAELIQQEMGTGPMKLKKDKEYYMLSKTDRKILKEEVKKKEHEAYELVRSLCGERKQRAKRLKARAQKEQDKLQRLLDENERKAKEKEVQLREERREEAVRGCELQKQRREEELHRMQEQQEKFQPASVYLYQKIEEQYKNNVLTPMLEDKKQRLAEKRSVLKPVTKEELEEHRRKFEVEAMRRQEERREELQKKKRQEAETAHMMKKKYKTGISEQIIKRDLIEKAEQDKRVQERKELREKMDEYATSLKEACPVVPSEDKIEELQKRIAKMKVPVREKRDVKQMYLISSLSKRVALRAARSADNKGAGSEGEEDNEGEEGSRSGSEEGASLKPKVRLVPRPKKSRSTKNDKNKTSVADTKELLKERQAQVEKMRKMDYLTELRIKREAHYGISKPGRYNWSQDIQNKHLSPSEKRERVEQKAKMIEERAKENEKLYYIKGGADKNMELGEYVSDMFLDAIKAKLSILNNL